MRTVVDRVLVALPVRSHYAQIQDVIDACARGGVECRYPVDVFQARLAGSLLETSGPAPFMRLPAARRDGRHLLKRSIDVLGATCGILVLSPLLVAISLAVALTSKGPPIFVQERYGLGKRRFQMFKFRTMVCEAEALQLALEARNEKCGPIFKIRDDPRITPLGRFLRSTSLDELPQLLNVLRGEMSLVGPRPMSVRDVGRFDEPWLMRRFSVLPGLTCLWQVSGRSNLTFDDWIALDLEYIDNWSLSLDARILVRTLPAICCRVGAV
jgi:exopolysaccharide biosynthesis polyprenyl glycosylphosphotransferase